MVPETGTNVQTSSCKLTVKIFCDFNETSIITRLQKNAQMSNFMKIGPV